MNKGVVIVTGRDGAGQLATLLDSLDGCWWPIYIVVCGASEADPLWLDSIAEKAYLIENADDGNELAAIRDIIDGTHLDEFVLLPDSFDVTDPTFLSDVFEYDGPVAIPIPGHPCAVKWRRETLANMNMAMTTTVPDFIRSYFAADVRPAWLFDFALDDEIRVPAEHVGHAPRRSEWDFR